MQSKITVKCDFNEETLAALKSMNETLSRVESLLELGRTEECTRIVDILNENKIMMSQLMEKSTLVTT